MGRPPPLETIKVDLINDLVATIHLISLGPKGMR
jgi:hypothetical protein